VPNLCLYLSFGDSRPAKVSFGSPQIVKQQIRHSRVSTCVLPCDAKVANGPPIRAREHAIRRQTIFRVREQSLDIFWLKDESPEDSANLPDPDVLAAEIAD
jgi:hypothetical protein